MIYKEDELGIQDAGGGASPSFLALPRPRPRARSRSRRLVAQTPRSVRSTATAVCVPRTPFPRPP